MGLKTKQETVLMCGFFLFLLQVRELLYCCHVLVHPMITIEKWKTLFVCYSLNHRQDHRWRHENERPFLSVFAILILLKLKEGKEKKTNSNDLPHRGMIALIQRDRS